MVVTPERLDAAYRKARDTLLAERTPQGHWRGELSASALSTATAVMALATVQKHTEPSGRFDGLITSGLGWLTVHQNPDGGWGDTVKSVSNISTTMLCRAAFHLTGEADSESLRRGEAWLFDRYGNTPTELAEAVRRRYGKDRTFAVPILTTCALAGLVSWREVPPLPFELACFPQSWFRFLRLHVVSYALPALIAIGQCVHFHRGTLNPLAGFVRHLAKKKSLRVLRAIQPSSGGYLEATPLTSFVTLSLASIGLAEHEVTVDAVKFLVRSARPDGSWAIDSDLATWLTTLSVNALAAADDLESLDQQESLRNWLLRQQHSLRHPYTGAAPGGWAWTDLPGGVPDADDTPGVLLALLHLDPAPDQPAWQRLQAEPEAASAIDAGVRWLVDLPNRDGGWPTFCRGWQHLPFDRSGSDLTAHALRALVAWWRSRFDGPPEKAKRMLANILTTARPWFSLNYWWLDMRLSGPFRDMNAWRDALHHGKAYLDRHQRPDGSWLPLWFGNQHAPDDENPVYGTTRVLAAYRDLECMNDESARRGVAWLLSVQNRDGGWGGTAATPSSVEETALAVEILLAAGESAEAAVDRGLAWLVRKVEDDGFREPSPIGFYFAKLWYFERLYPILFTVATLGRARRGSMTEMEPRTN